MDLTFDGALRKLDIDVVGATCSCNHETTAQKLRARTLKFVKKFSTEFNKLDLI